MYIVIMGAGRVGLNLAKALIAAKQDVALIENDSDSCSNAARELDTVLICGNGTDIKTLLEAKIDDADVFVAATGNDEANLLSCILVKDYNIPKVIARVSDPDHDDAFRKVGIDMVVSPEITAAGYLEKLITRPKIADLIVIGKGNAELLELTVGNAKMSGKKIGDISPTKDYIIAAIHKNGEIRIPKEGVMLKKGDRISILAKKKAIKAVTKKFTK